MPKVIRPIRIEGQLAYVPLTKGYEAVIDVADVPLVDGVSWFVAKIGGSIYAFCAPPAFHGSTRTSIRMHRVIMGNPDGFEVDHIDGNGLNNTRGNLRVATRSENARNRGKPRNNTSGFKGVYWHKPRKKWRARVMINGKHVSLGLFATPEAAHAAYCAAAKDIHGAFWRGE